MEEELLLWILGLGAGGILAATNRTVVKVVATGYVALTEAVGRVVGPIREEWQEAVNEAKRERQQQAAQAGQHPRRVRAKQRQGEEIVKQSAAAAGATAQAAGGAAGGG